MQFIVSNKKLILSGIVVIVIILGIIIYFKKPTQDEQIEAVREELITTFKMNDELFRSVAIFVQVQKGEIFSVSTPYKATSGLEAIIAEPYKVLELDKESEIYKNIDSIIYQHHFNEIYKIEGLIHFKKPSSYGIEQGVVYSPNDEKPKNLYTERLEENWYYYQDQLE